MGLHADLGRRVYTEYKDLDRYRRILSMATGSIAVRFHLLLRRLLRRHRPGSYFGRRAVVIRCSHGRLGMGGVEWEAWGRRRGVEYL